MAYWTIDFTTRAGRHIHIRISGKSGNTDVALTPSDNPCSIEEEGKENLFMPIKTQSGYVEVITDSIDLAAEIIPTTGGTRSVAIYETATPTSYTTPLWAGYVQPKLLTFKMWRGKQKLQIPIECMLSALKYEPVRLPSTSEVSIGMILYRMMGGFDYAYFQGGIVMERNGNTSDQERAWLRKKVYTTLFDEDLTQYDVLEKVCTFFGWTVRQHGISAYFVANHRGAILARWHFVSPDGKEDLLYTDAEDRFPTMQIIHGEYSTMQLKNIPAELNGWSVYCRYSNNSGTTDTASAKITVETEAAAA